MTDLVPLDAIRVNERDRSDLGDIAELAASIAAVGLLHPVVVNANNDLVAGERRLAALVELGWTEVPVTVVDLNSAETVLRAELDENTCRKSLTPYEASKARERRAAVLAPTQSKGGRPPANTTTTDHLCDCGEAFDMPVWHCPTCGHHWSMDRADCAHCLEQDAPAEPSTRALADDEPERETSPNLREVSRKARKARETAKVAAIGTGYSGSTLDKVDRIRSVAERGVIQRGKTEVPAPEPVREVARAALVDVQKTGAAVDASHRKVEAAIQRYVEEDEDSEARRARKGWFDALSAARKFREFDIATLSDVLTADDWDTSTPLIDKIAEQVDVFRTRRSI